MGNHTKQVPEMSKLLLITIIMITYIILGAALLCYLERENEVLMCKQTEQRYRRINEESLDRIISLFRIFGVNQAEESWEKLTPEIDRLLENFSWDVRQEGNDGMDCDYLGMPESSEIKWSFTNAVLFTTQSITTIGKN